MRTIFFIISVFYLEVSVAAAQVDESTKFQLEIKQTNFEGLDFIGNNIFKIREDKLIILQRVVANDTILKYKEVYVRKIKKRELKHIRELSLKLKDLNNEYLKKMIDGIRWEITMIEADNIKKITLENLNVSEVDGLFNAINELIPMRKPKIYLL